MSGFKQSELIKLVGLASTDSSLVQFFEHHGLGKLPKTEVATFDWTLS